MIVYKEILSPHRPTRVPDPVGMRFRRELYEVINRVLCEQQTADAATAARLVRRRPPTIPPQTSRGTSHTGCVQLRTLSVADGPGAAMGRGRAAALMQASGTRAANTAAL